MYEPIKWVKLVSFNRGAPRDAMHQLLLLSEYPIKSLPNAFRPSWIICNQDGVILQKIIIFHLVFHHLNGIWWIIVYSKKLLRKQKQSLLKLFFEKKTRILRQLNDTICSWSPCSMLYFWVSYAWKSRKSQVLHVGLGNISELLVQRTPAEVNVARIGIHWQLRILACSWKMIN